MGRPRLPLGMWGKITTTKQPDGRYRARCRFRGLDGKERSAEATAPTRAKAERALIERVKTRIGDRDSALGGDSPLRVLAGLWWDTIEQRAALPTGHKDHLNESTRRDYLRYKNYVLEDCGGLALRECTPSRIHAVIEARAAGAGTIGRMMKRTMVGMFDHAVMLDAMDHNPAQRLKVSAPPAPSTRALTAEEVEVIRHRIRVFEGTAPGAVRRVGRPRRVILGDFFELQLALGARIGEVLALQWDNIRGLDDNGPVMVEISGTLKRRSQAEAKRLNLPAGLYRQGSTKTAAGHRVVSLPGWAVPVLRRLHAARMDGVVWVLATSAGTPLGPSNVRADLHDAMGAGFEWVTPHTLRRTAATAITVATGSAHAASLVLGHASTAITEAAYVERSKVVPDVRGAMEALAPRVTDLKSVG